MPHDSTNGWYEETELLFTKGYLKRYTPPPLLRHLPARVEVYRKGDKGGAVTVPDIPWEWAFLQEARHFVECVRDNTVPRSSGEDSINDVVVLEDILKIGFGS